MKIQLVKVSANSAFKTYKAFNGGPPENIFSVAAATPSGHDVELFDETIGQKFKYRRGVELVAFFASTPDVMQAYAYAKKLHKKGIAVVIGGLHATFLPDEASKYADAVMVGEEEMLWPQVLQDFQAGRMKPIYRSETAYVMKNMNAFPTKYAKPYVTDGTWSVVASRGCKFQCSYCTVHKFFPTFRTRPVGEIVDEIKASGVEYVEVHADNLIADRDYAMELFEGLKSCNVRWVGEATLNIAEYPEILETAAESGLIYLVVGLETLSKDALKNAGKGFIKLDYAKENIRRLHEYQITVDSCMLFGFDEHDTSIFEETLDWVDDIELDMVHPNIMTPFPGTNFFEQLDQEGRILTYDWADYDCSHAVYQPKQMSPQDLENGVNWVYQKHNSMVRSMKRRARRVKNIGWEAAAYLG